MKRFLSLIFILLVLGVFMPQVSWALLSNDPRAYQYGYEQAGVYRAWDFAVGSPEVVVAVIDNGFDTFHPDLVGNVWKNEKENPNNNIDDDHNGYIDDVWGWNFLDNNNNPQPNVSRLGAAEKRDELYNHGTFVAGIIGAVGNNNRDGAGVAWNVKLMNLKVLGNDGFGNFLPVADAIRYAVDNGADVINISMAGDPAAQVDDAVDYAYSKGIAVVAAMGNYNGNASTQPRYPACSDAGSVEPHVLGVSAVGQDRRLAYFSNTGTKCVDITAPGVSINSLVRFAPESGLYETYKNGWQGTSFAAPFVAGTAALVKSARPEWGAKEIYQAILSTTHHTPSDDEEAYANLYGKGLLQVHRAVAYAQGRPLPLTMFQTSTDANVPVVPVAPPITPTTTITPPIVKPSHAKTFVAIGAIGQMRDAYNDSFELGGQYERPEAKNTESVAAYGTGSNQVIVTVRVGAKNVRVVSIYNNKWQLQQTWNSNFTVPVQVAMGSSMGKIIIALVPTQSNTVVYRLYDEQGTQLQEKIQSIAHKGVHVALVGASPHVVLTTGNQTVFRYYGEDGTIVKEFPISGLGTNPYLAIGDVNNDNAIDYVVGSGPGHNDQVRIYSKDGTEQRSFSPFGDGRKNGVSVIVVDADANGTQDLLTYSANTSGPIRAWTARAKNAGEWAAPFTGSFFLLPR